MLLSSVLSPVLATASKANTISTKEKASVRQLPSLAEDVAQKVLAQFKNQQLKTEELAFSFLDLQDPANPVASHFRGEVPIYPASVVKMFYLAAVHQWLQDGKLKDSPELQRALRDMIVDSSNDATSYVVDALTETTSGPQLVPDELKVWGEKRNAINRYFQAQGYTNLNINQKPWNEGPYGRERQFVGATYTNRNMLTTQATAQLLTQIMQGEFVSKARSVEMQQLLLRDPHRKASPDSQAVDFLGMALREIPGAKQWSKAGWTSTVRHDAAYVELPVSTNLPQGARFVLVVFTSGHSNETQILPAVARGILSSYYKLPAP